MLKHPLKIDNAFRVLAFGAPFFSEPAPQGDKSWHPRVMPLRRWRFGSKGPGGTWNGGEPPSSCLCEARECQWITIYQPYNSIKLHSSRIGNQLIGGRLSVGGG